MGVAKFLTKARLFTAAPFVIGAALATAASAQDQSAQSNSAANLRLPSNPQLFGNSLPSVVKARVLVNGEVITQSDIDQRLALLAIANEGGIPADQVDTLRQQVLSNLIDETLQIQAAKVEEIEIDSSDIDRAVERVAGNVKQTPQQLELFLKARGSSIKSIRRQIQGELAWRRLQSKKIESGISVGQDEAKAIIDKLEASKGSTEYRVGEIFLASTVANEAQVQANIGQIFQALQQGASFVGYARQYSQSSSAAVGGDLGWLRPEQLPDALAVRLREMHAGQLSPPIKVQGGYSILAVQDERKILTQDPRNAVLSLKQVTINFPAGITRPQAEPVLAKFAGASQSIGGCGGAEKLASDFKGDVISSDEVKMRDLPPQLQEMMQQMQVGQATRPFGSLEEGVRVLVLCGREIADTSLPTQEQVMGQLTEERMNMRSRRYLRDLRRDAIIDFR